MKTLSKKNIVKYNKIYSEVTLHGRHSHYTEAGLIKKLEDLGIGRPSTFATIVDTIIERGYVKKMDIDGIIIKSNEYTLYENQIEIIEKEKTFGKERGKLLIQSMGILTIEFLIEHFNSLFSYDYTKKMELDLDEISMGSQKEYYKSCERCLSEIKELLKPLKEIKKKVFKIDEDHDLVYEKYGPVIRKCIKNANSEEGFQKYEYKTMKKGFSIDMNKLEEGEYTLEELMENEPKILGEYNGDTIIIKNGQYGAYIEYGDKRESIKSLNIDIPMEKITYKDIMDAFNIKKGGEIVVESNSKILRIINNDISIRKGKFGGYIYYKTEKMSKPKFYNIQKFKESYTYCDIEIIKKWINETYKLDII
jgi:DNA topoisomerase-1